MLNWLKRSLGALLALCMLVSMLPTALAADRSELEGHWAKESLTYFADQDWLEGYEDGTYKPDRTITRAEFIKLVNRVCGFTEQTEGVLDKFTDVKKDQWYYKDIAIALSAGYVEGDSETTVSPNASITREQAFTMLGRVAGLSSKDLSALDAFKDSGSISSYAKPFMAALVSGGYVNGYEDKTLRPQRNITRAEAVKTMYVCLELLTTHYVLMNIPYADFYAAELKNDVKVDGVTSATLNKTRTPSLAGGSYHVDAKGTDITGITFPVKVPRGVSLDAYTQVTDDNKVEITVTNRGQTSTTTLTGKDALFESESYAYYVLSETPSCYKEVTLDKDGKLTFGKLQGAEPQKLDVTASITTKTSYGDYQVDVDADSEKLGTVYGVIFSTKEGSDYGMRHLENVWRTTEIAWCAGYTTEVHGCPTSSDHYKAMMGQTINKITYITASGVYTIDTELYVPVKTGSKLSVANANVLDGKTAVTAELPEDYQAVYAVTDAKGAAVSGMTVKDGKLTWTATDAKIGAYTLNVTDASGKYAPLSASFELQTDAMPAQAAADNQSIVKAEGASDEELSAFIAAITNVNVNGKDYAATGKRGVKVIKSDGAIDFTTAPFQADAVDGKYVLTITATGYAKALTVTVPKKVAPMTDEQKTQLTALKDEAGEILAKYDEETIKATPALAALKEHYDEAVALLAAADATEEKAKELLGELPGLIEAAKALTPAAETYTGTATVTPDEDEDFDPYTLNASIQLEGGKIKAFTTTITSTEKKDVKLSAQATTALNAALSGKTLEEAASTDVTIVDGVTGATCSSKAIIEALKTAEKAS